MWKCADCGREFARAGQQHFCAEDSGVDEYIGRQEEALRPLLEQIRATIQAAAPEASETISWRMPTYRQGGNLIHFAAFKNHVGIYPGPEAVEAFSDRLANHKTSKGAIRLPLSEPIDLDLISDIVKWRVQQVQPGGR